LIDGRLRRWVHIKIRLEFGNHRRVQRRERYDQLGMGIPDTPEFKSSTTKRKGMI